MAASFESLPQRVDFITKPVKNFGVEVFENGRRKSFGGFGNEGEREADDFSSEKISSRE